MNNATNRTLFTHPSLAKVGPMTGVLEYDHREGATLFYPDEEFHTPLYRVYGIEALGGLYLEGATIS